ncbi:hypothetical protein EXU57_00345 [Segetibacter sp. 3557_3]|uniref:hypothetical protein n=1 Tax=Segetibacter sp. 3557_3 TaxID=2547429 RepID=UPI001058F438|nr:hypothetical protein [Segetibacter sp. 3557_3]TDH28563.1 hypothetical protein EXU57_00345 [Segetibacter sp. 3557_3]
MKKILGKLLHSHLTRPFVSSPAGSSINVTDFTPGYFHSFGTNNSDKMFYVIWLANGGSGFFSNFANVLCHLYIAESLNMIPVIDFRQFKTIYNVADEVNGTSNAWEYYFKPVSNFTPEEVYTSKNVFFCSGHYPPQFSYNLSELTQLFPLYNSLVQFSPALTERINRYKDKFRGRVLGIHFRGQEMKIAAAHPLPPTEKQMLAYTAEIISKNHIDKLFLVTEHEPYLDLFKKHYGDKLIYTDSFRTRGENAYNQDPRKHHRYLLGLEVLTDTLLLADCTGLLCGNSNVSEFAKFAGTGKLEFVYNIFNGMNSSNRLLARYLYRIRKHTIGFKTDITIDHPILQKSV